MPVPRLNYDACRARNLAAAANGFNAMPVTFSAAPPPPPDGWRLVIS